MWIATRVAKNAGEKIMANVSNTTIEQPGGQQEQTQGVQGVQGVQGGIEQAGQAETSLGSPITNEAYDVIAALKSKLEGLEAYRKYASDGNSQLWHELVKAEIPAVGRLVEELERMVKDGKFRMQEPTEAHH
jgi:hypothetical protein